MDGADRARVVMLLDTGQDQEALDLLTPMLATEPNSSELLCLNATALIGLARFHDAMASAKQASTVSPSSGEPHRIASIVLTKVGDVPGSARAAREAVRLAPGDSASWERFCLSVGAELNELGRSGDRADLARIREVSEEVLAAADRVVALAPTSASAYSARGYALTCARRQEPAREAFRRAKELDPDGSSAQLGMGAAATPIQGTGLPRRVAVVWAVMVFLVFAVAIGVAVAR